MTCCAPQVPPEHLRRMAEELFRRSTLQETVDHVAEINRLVVSGQKGLAADERARALQLPIGASNYAADFSLAITHAAQARVAFRAALDSDTWRELRVQVDVGSPEFGRAIATMRNCWAQAVNRNDNLTADRALEMVGIYDSVADTLRTQGLDGLVTLLDAQLGEFSQILTVGRDYGREPHSPLEWWQWLIIIGTLLIAITALVACFAWSGCAWVYAIFVGMCGVVASSIGGPFAALCLVLVP